MDRLHLARPVAGAVTLLLLVHAAVADKVNCRDLIAAAVLLIGGMHV